MIENMRCSIKSPFNHGLEDMQNYITLPFSKAKQKSYVIQSCRQLSLVCLLSALCVALLALKTKTSSLHPPRGV